MKRVALLILVLLASCGFEQVSDTKATLVEAKDILETAIARLDQIDIDKDGQLNQLELVNAIAMAWMEWQARTRQ